MAFAIIQLRNWLTSIFDEDHDGGASVVEYALLLALIAVVCLVAVNTIGSPTSEGLSKGYSAFP
jgi:Flp pilus assembly pilin Flp